MANTESFEPGSTMRVRVEELPPKPPTLKVVAPEPEAEAPKVEALPPAPARGVPDDSARILPALRAIAMILSTRALVFATAAGGFLLGAATIYAPSWTRVGVMACYGVFVIAPAIFLEVRRK